MKFRRATEEDLDQVWAIIEQAKAFLKQNEVDQWQDGYPAKEDILSDIRANINYVLEDDGLVIATIVADRGPEQDYAQIFEGAWLNEAPYAVLHRVATLNSIKQKGVASRLIKKAEQMIAGWGICNIRIDTHRDNIPMQKTLSKNAYTYCGIIYLCADGSKRLAYQKQLEVL
jgi:GNAT superfamily N-acetyltransferase